MAGNRGRGSRHHARSIRGRAPGKTDSMYHNTGRAQEKKPRCPVSRTRATFGHLAETELTVIVSPSKAPVTVAFLPACWSSVARAALSVVSKM